MTEYEIRVDGLIGPVVRSGLSDLTIAVAPVTTVLSGTVPSADTLLGVLHALAAHGVVPIDIRVSRDG